MLDEPSLCDDDETCDDAQRKAQRVSRQACLGPCLLAWGSSPVWRTFGSEAEAEAHVVHLVRVGGRVLGLGPGLGLGLGLGLGFGLSSGLGSGFEARVDDQPQGLLLVRTSPRALTQSPH